MIAALARNARNRFHNARAELLLKLIQPTAGMSVLDLGSGWRDPFIWKVAERRPLQITCADLFNGPIRAAERRGFRGVLLKEGQPLPFDDAEFDLVISNSVIEHATGPKDQSLDRSITQREWSATARQNQSSFANEIRRVGKQYFVQTPHRGFPFDQHLWLPFTNFLPHSLTRRLVPITDRYWVKRTNVADWNLLGRRDMQRLFPDAAIVYETLFGLPKSIIAYKSRPRPERAAVP